MATATPSIINSDESFALSILHSVWKHRCLSILVEFKIPELICNHVNSSVSIEEIAAKTGCQTSTGLYPVMRLLAQWGIGIELENKHFSKNNALEQLSRDKGPSLGHFVAYECSDEQFSALKCLPACVKNGNPAFVLNHGMNHFEYMYGLDKLPYDKSKMFEGSAQYNIGSDERRREFAENYSSANAYFTKLATAPNVQGVTNLYNVFPWSTCNKLVDVGGSSGHFLASILKLSGCEHIQGYVLDLPAMVDEAKSKAVHELRVPANRLQFVPHDLTQLPSSDLLLQADTVIMKNFLIIFTKDLEMMKKVLGNCRQLFSSEGGRLLVIEFCAPEGGDTTRNVGINGMEMGSQSIQRLSIVANYIWSKTEWVDNLNKAGDLVGFRLQQVYDTFNGGSTMFELEYKP